MRAAREPRRATTWGDDPSYAEIGRYAWYLSNCLTEAYGHVVGQKPPNRFGLYDMIGNVSEWVQDFWAYYPSANAVTDPTGPATGTYRGRRSGDWSDHARYLPRRVPHWPDSVERVR